MEIWCPFKLSMHYGYRMFKWPLARDAWQEKIREKQEANRRPEYRYANSSNAETLPVLGGPERKARAC